VGAPSAVPQSATSTCARKEIFRWADYDSAMTKDTGMGQVWSSGDAYEPYVGRWSRKVAVAFIDWLGRPPGLRWLDVGCGTGAMTQTILDRAEPARIQGIDPSAAFIAHARARISDPRASFQVGDAMKLPLEDAAVDACVSGLVLNFVPDAWDAVAEMRRVTRPSGVVGAYVWDYAGEMQMMRHFWTAAGELDAKALELDEGARFNLCRPDELRRCYEESGLGDVAVAAIDIDSVFRDFDDYWQPFLGGQAPAPAYLASLDGGAQALLRERVRDRLPVAADGTIALKARAWAVKGLA
jgi:SAM-dependent methyltransferase